MKIELESGQTDNKGDPSVHSFTKGMTGQRGRRQSLETRGLEMLVSAWKKRESVLTSKGVFHRMELPRGEGRLWCREEGKL